jgi:hypothetical protein
LIRQRHVFRAVPAGGELFCVAHGKCCQPYFSDAIVVASPGVDEDALTRFALRFNPRVVIQFSQSKRELALGPSHGMFEFPLGWYGVAIRNSTRFVAIYGEEFEVDGILGNIRDAIAVSPTCGIPGLNVSAPFDDAWKADIAMKEERKRLILQMAASRAKDDKQAPKVGPSIEEVVRAQVAAGGYPLGVLYDHVPIALLPAELLSWHPAGSKLVEIFSAATRLQAWMEFKGVSVGAVVVSGSSGWNSVCLDGTMNAQENVLFRRNGAWHGLTPYQILSMRGYQFFDTLCLNYVPPRAIGTMIQDVVDVPALIAALGSVAVQCVSGGGRTRGHVTASISAGRVP